MSSINRIPPNAIVMTVPANQQQYATTTATPQQYPATATGTGANQPAQQQSGDYRLNFRAQLRQTRTWCCSYWVFLHIWMIGLMIVNVWNGYNYWVAYVITGWSVFLVTALIQFFGVFVGAYGLYGMYNCVPVAFLLLVIYIVIDILMDIYLIIELGFYWGFFDIFFLLMWAFCAYSFFR